MNRLNHFIMILLCAGLWSCAPRVSSPTPTEFLNPSPTFSVIPDTATPMEPQETATPTPTPLPTNTQVPTPTSTPTVPPLPEMQQVNQDGFGDKNNASVFALEIFQGYLYAGTRNHQTGCEIWRYDGSGWDSIIQGCFGKEFNPSVSDFIVFNGSMYAGLWVGANEEGIVEGAEIWRSEDGVNWENVVSDGFDAGGRNIEITRLFEYKDDLYAASCDGTNEYGLEIWRSSTGEESSWGKVVSGGFGNIENICITASSIYNGILYVGTFTLDGTTQLYSTDDGVDWEFVNDFNSGGMSHRRVSALEVFDDRLYAALIEKGEAPDEIIARIFRCQICKGEDWEIVLEGPYEYPGTYRKPGLEVYGDYLYTVIGNFYDLGNDINTKGLELWRTEDGLDWERLALGGIDDGNNAWTYFDNGLVVYEGELYIGLDNKATGGEVWKVSD